MAAGHLGGNYVRYTGACGINWRLSLDGHHFQQQMSSTENNNNTMDGDDTSWNEVEAEDVVTTQVQKIEFEEEQRRKLSAKDFPLRMTATTEDSSDDSTSRNDAVAAGIVEEESLEEQKEPVITEDSKKEAIPASTPTFQLPKIQPLVLYPKTTTKTAVSGAAVAPSIGEPSPVDSFQQNTTPSTQPATSNPKTRLQFSPLALPPTSCSSDGFAQILKERTRQRRAQEDAAVSAVRVQVTRLEAALAAESKRRVAALQLLHEQANQAAATMQEELQTQMKDEIQTVHTRLDRFEERLQQLETKVTHDMMALRHDIGRDTERMQAQLRTLQGQVAREEEKLHKRHGQTMEHMQTVSEEYVERWKVERQERLTAVQNLQETMQSVHSSRAQNLATFEGQLSYELEQLKLAVETESGERQTYDQEIVDGLNRYIQQLQESLAQAVTQGRVY